MMHEATAGLYKPYLVIGNNLLTDKNRLLIASTLPQLNRVVTVAINPTCATHLHSIHSTEKVINNLFLLYTDGKS